MKRRLTIFICTIALTIIFAFLIPHVKTNYDMTKYLPDDSDTRVGIAILEEEFGVRTMIQILVDDVSIEQVTTIKNEILDVNLVESVVWLDDYVDLNLVPIEFIDPVTLSPFYQDGDALLYLTFSTDAYDVSIEMALDEIELILNTHTFAMRGEALNNIESRNIANHEVIKIMVLIIPVVIIILILASHAWIEPLLILATLAFAVVINYGTNIFLGDVSYITKTMALALQLAMSLDYSLFLIHRYYEERKTESNPILAVKSAVKKSFPSITASALTTIAGFVSLIFMSYRIGMDIGLVLSKGILFSYLSVMLVMPVFLVWFDKWIQKSMHRTLIPSFKKLGGGFHKARWVLLSIFIVLIGLSVYFQDKTTYLYGNIAIASESSDVYMDNEKISQKFGTFNPIVILFENDTVEKELSLVAALMTYEHIDSIQALVTTVDPMIPREFIPQETLGNFIGDQYSRVIINTTLVEENEDLYALNDYMNLIASSLFDDYHIIGVPSSTTEIKDSVLSDSTFVVIFSILAVGFIIMMVFRSLSIPIILVGVIQTAIWINVSILFIQGISTLYIGYLVVMSLQLGATIDYAVLLTNRYMEYRLLLSPKEAMAEAFEKSSISIFVSSIILAIAGFIEGWFSEISSVTEIGMLLGKGAVISALLVFIFLPAILLIFDKLIQKTTLYRK